MRPYEQRWLADYALALAHHDQGVAKKRHGANAKLITFKKSIKRHLLTINCRATTCIWSLSFDLRYGVLRGAKSRRLIVHEGSMSGHWNICTSYTYGYGSAMVICDRSDKRHGEGRPKVNLSQYGKVRFGKTPTTWGLCTHWSQA